jgi:hypothetical protein
VSIAVKNNKYALEYASDELKNNFEIVKIAIQKNEYALNYASKDIKFKMLLQYNKNTHYNMQMKK